MLAFERGGGAIGDDGAAFFVADFQDLADFLGGFGEGHGIGRGVRVVGFVLAVLVTHGAGGDEAITEEGEAGEGVGNGHLAKLA